MLFDAEQVAVRRSGICADEYGLVGLEDLVVAADADGSKLLLVVEAACRGDGLVQDVVDRAQGERIVEEVAEQFLDAAEGAMADKAETEDELSEPGLGDGQPEEELRRVGGRGVEGLVDGVVGVVELLVDELAADLMLLGQVGDGLSGEGVQCQLLAYRQGQQTGGSGKARSGWLRIGCSWPGTPLDEAVVIPSIYGVQAFSAALPPEMLPRFEPGRISCPSPPPSDRACSGPR